MAWRLPRTAAEPPRPARPPGRGAIVLVLPARDEAGRVASVVRRAPESIAGRAVRVLVVDDGSTDATASEARAAGAEVVAHPHPRGLGAAVRTGFAAAVARGAAVVAFCDADGEYAPEELPALVAPILAGEADYVVGSRFAGRITRMLRRRRLGNHVLTALVRWVSRLPVTDGQSGFRALSRDAARDAVIEHDYNYAQVLTLDLAARGYRYAEVPITYRFRRSGRSFVRLGPYLRAVIPAMWRVVQRAGATRVPTASRAHPRRWTGIATAVIALGFAGVAAARAWPDARPALAEARPPFLAAGLLLAAVGMLALAAPWRFVARCLGAPALRASRWRCAYFIGELAKYVPGGIWPLLGRSEQARRAGVPAGTAYASVLMSLGYAYLSAGMVLGLVAGPALAASGRVGPVAWTLAILPAGVLALQPGVLERVIRGAERLAGRPLTVTPPPWKRSLALTAAYLPAWLAIGAATVAIARALAPDAPPLAVFAAAVASWLAGFLTVPAPGGLGVREATFAAVAPLPFGPAIAIAATARATFVLVDVAAFAVAVVARRRERATSSVLDDVRAEEAPRRTPPSPVEAPVGA